MRDALFHTPVLVLAFNRPETTQEVFNLLKKIRPKYLYVSVDGPRAEKVNETSRCAQTRNIFLEQIDWDCELKTRFLDNNLGCRYGVSSGITWFLEQVEEGIILEDDCLIDESFFPYAADLLTRYKDSTEVMHISASNFYGRYTIQESYYFSLYNHIWGWASWRRAWIPNYEVDLKHIERRDFRNTLHTLFERKIDQRFWLDMFDYAKSGNINTWDYQWMFSMWQAGGTSITPRANMVSNIGFGEGATNTQIQQEDFMAQKVWPANFPMKHPNSQQIDKEKDEFTSDFLFKIKKQAKLWNLKIKIAGKMPVGLKNRIKRILQ